jgi:hypothetical protein
MGVIRWSPKKKYMRMREKKEKKMTASIEGILQMECMRGICIFTVNNCKLDFLLLSTPFSRMESGVFCSDNFDCTEGIIMSSVLDSGVGTMVTKRSISPLSLYLRALLVRHNTFSNNQCESDMIIGHMSKGKGCMIR